MIKKNKETTDTRIEGGSGGEPATTALLHTTTNTANNTKNSKYHLQIFQDAEMSTLHHMYDGSFRISVRLQQLLVFVSTR